MHYIWWSNISQQELANLMQSMMKYPHTATPHTDCYFWPFMFIKCLWNLSFLCLHKCLHILIICWIKQLKVKGCFSF